MARMNYSKVHKGDCSYRDSNKTSYIDDGLPAIGSYDDKKRSLAKTKKDSCGIPQKRNVIDQITDFFSKKILTEEIIKKDEILAKFTLYLKKKTKSNFLNSSLFHDQARVEFAALVLNNISKSNPECLFHLHGVFEVWLWKEVLRNSLNNNLRREGIDLNAHKKSSLE